VGSGVFLILLGLFKKVAIADALATYVNTTFADVGRAGWVSLATAMFAFALQIYGDFCGYTDIARGSSRLLGIELLVNFRQPYLSRNTTEFWQRWHISLSTWLRDYLYVPLGGNRGSRIATYRNLILTMLLGGLWHGAAWTFVIWGLGHGVLLALHRRARAGHADIARADRPWSARRDLVPTAFTFVVVAALFVVFRASTMSEARTFFEGLLTLRPGPIDANAVITLVYAAVALFAIDLLQRANDDEAPILAWRPAPSGALLGVMAALVIVFSGGSPVPFIYFRF
jgi:D-alanyl-lipoteichoic acid acyltransferase DltB (MBOAT superfamily)